MPRPRPSSLARALALGLAALAPALAIGQAPEPTRFTAAAAGGVRVASPQATFAVGTGEMQLAMEVARAHWGTNPCGGQIALSWSPAAADINATSSWTNPYSAYDHPQLNGDCRVAFNPHAEFDWAKFCTVMVHEYGHLAGRPHAGDPHDVMAAYYADPLPACQAATPAALRAAPSTTFSVQRTTTRRAAVAKKRSSAKKKSNRRKARARCATKKRRSHRRSRATRTKRCAKRTSGKRRAKRATRRH
jgi:hypothetical protein